MGIHCAKLVTEGKFNESYRDKGCEVSSAQKKGGYTQNNTSISLCLNQRIPEENRVQDGRKIVKLKEGTTTSDEDIRKFYDFEPKVIGKNSKKFIFFFE